MRDALLKSYFSVDARVKVWKKLAALLRHNVSELQALTMLQERYAARADPVAGLLFGGRPLAVVFSRIIAESNNGMSLDVALADWVPHEEIMLLRGGKKSGRLVEALNDCVTLIEAKRKIKGSIVSAVSMPLLLVGMLVGLLLTLSIYVVPELSLLSNPASWDGPAAVLYEVASFVSSIAGAVTLAVFFVTLAAAMGTLPYWTGKIRIRFDAAPPWSLYRLMTGSVWLFTVATLLRANNSLDFILRDMLGSNIMKPWLRERVQAISDRYQRDANFGRLLLDLNMNFPDKELVEDLAVYASMPDFHKNMYAIAREWLDEGVLLIAAQARIVNVGLIVCIIAVLCGLGMAIGSMQSQLNNSMGV